MSGSSVQYFGNTSGHLALPAGGGKRPAVVMIHEWWGLTDLVKKNAEELAHQGYVVLAVDLYGGQVATDPDTAHKLMQAVDHAVAIENMKAAVAHLRARPDVDAAKVGCIGWCFGGACSLRLALNQKDLAACVIYYGVQLETDVEKLKGLPPVLGNFGADDQMPTPETVRAFEAALKQAGVQNHIHLYAGAGHAFANPTSDERYRPEPARLAWGETLTFFERNLKKA